MSGASAASIYPIATGYTWTYAVTAIGAGDSCSASNGVTTVLGPVTLGGKAGFEEQNVCTPAGQKVTLAVEGDRVFVWNAGTSAWEVAIDAPVEEGHSWTVTVGTRTWHDAGTVTVPAGTFTDCWRADQVGDVTGSYTYCRGVGLVAETNQDAQGNGSDVKLTKKSF